MQKIDPTTSSFESLIMDKCVYVDKTQYLYNLITWGARYNFLSRPRRFGKSLTVSTLKAIFQGKKELFKDLYIGSTGYEFKEYPVVHIDFSDLVVTKAGAFNESLLTVLNRIADDYKVALKGTAEVKHLFKDLIIGLYHQYGKVSSCSC